MGIVEDMAKELEDAINGVLDAAKAAVENPDRAGTNDCYRVAVDKFENLQQTVNRLSSINVKRISRANHTYMMRSWLGIGASRRRG